MSELTKFSESLDEKFSNLFMTKLYELYDLSEPDWNLLYNFVVGKRKIGVSDESDPASADEDLNEVIFSLAEKFKRRRKFTGADEKALADVISKILKSAQEVFSVAGMITNRVLTLSYLLVDLEACIS
jgi:hypothetical protein